MVHPVVNITEEQAAAAIEGLDPDKVPNVIVFLLRPSADAGPAKTTSKLTDRDAARLFEFFSAH